MGPEEVTGDGDDLTGPATAIDLPPPRHPAQEHCYFLPFRLIDAPPLMPTGFIDKFNLSIEIIRCWFNRINISGRICVI